MMDELPIEVIDLIFSYLPGNLRYKVLYGTKGTDKFGFNNLQPIKLSVQPFMEYYDIFQLMKVDLQWGKLAKYNDRTRNWINITATAVDFPINHVSLGQSIITNFLTYSPESVSLRTFDYDSRVKFTEFSDDNTLDKFWYELHLNRASVAVLNKINIQKLSAVKNIDCLVVHKVKESDLTIIQQLGIKELELNIKGPFNIDLLSEMNLMSLKLILHQPTIHMFHLPQQLTHIEIIENQNLQCSFNLNHLTNLSSCIIRIVGDTTTAVDIKFPDNLTELTLIMKNYHIIPYQNFFPPRLKSLEITAFGNTYHLPTNIKTMVLGDSNRQIYDDQQISQNIPRIGSFPHSIHYLRLNGHFPNIPDLSDLRKLLELRLHDISGNRNNDRLRLPPNLQILQFDGEGTELSKLQWNDNLIDVTLNGHGYCFRNPRFPESIKFLTMVNLHHDMLRTLPLHLVGLDIHNLLGNETTMKINLAKSVKVLRYYKSHQATIDNIIPRNTNLHYIFLHHIKLTARFMADLPTTLIRLSLKGCSATINLAQLDLSNIKLQELDIDDKIIAIPIKLPSSMMVLSMLNTEQLTWIDGSLISDFEGWTRNPYNGNGFELRKTA